MNRVVLILGFLCTHLLGISQPSAPETDTLPEKLLEEVIISANKFAERKRFVTQKVDVITERHIRTANAQTTGDLLVQSGSVFVQKSQQGGSSPVIRGFEASRVLLVIDGIRMNNAIYRAGHLQNVITVDQNILERVEVMHGPASTLYGSDALGGVIHLRTKLPTLSVTSKLKADGSAMSRFSTANDEKTVHFDLSLGGKKIGWLQSYTFSDFGDLKMGSDYPDDYPSFGRRDSFILHLNGIDTVVANPDTRVQKFSGYRQWDILQKIIFKPNDRFLHQLNLQHSNSTDIPRYDRLQDKRNFGGSRGTTLRWAEWFYGPQTRYLASYVLEGTGSGLVEQYRVNLHYQHITESRQQREFRRYDRFDSRIEKLQVAGFNIDTRKKWNNNELTVGTDLQWNDVVSRASRKNLQTGVVQPLDTRYPDGKNRMTYWGMFAQHIGKFAGNKLILNDGLRLQYVSLRSNIRNNSFFNLPITEFENNNLAVTGNLGLVYLPDNNFRVSLGLATGFRQPNIDDLSRIFESSTALRRVVIPNPSLEPEYTYNIDLGITQLVADKIKFDVTGFYTFFRNAITLAPTTLNGQDSILYNGIQSAVYSNRNFRKANLSGFNVNVQADITKRLRYFITYTYTYGRFLNKDGSKIPLDHIPPSYGKTSLTYTDTRFSTEIFVLYNGWKKIRDYNPDGEDNQQYATPDGMPSWFTLNWRSQVQLTNALGLQLFIENILDRNYRHFGSGFSAAGRNYGVALRFQF